MEKETGKSDGMGGYGGHYRDLGNLVYVTKLGPPH